MLDLFARLLFRIMKNQVEMQILSQPVIATKKYHLKFSILSPSIIANQENKVTMETF